jgi:DNA (cytosine-5)-methyltransferase 1
MNSLHEKAAATPEHLLPTRKKVRQDRSTAYETLRGQRTGLEEEGVAGRTYRIGELFCGAGGLALGAKLAKLTLSTGDQYRCEPVWAVDYNRWACRTFAHNFGIEPVFGPVQSVKIEDLGQIDGLMFGFPCNDYSMVGEHKGLDGEYGPLYTYGVKALNAYNPDWFLAENVSGLTSANEGEAFLKILEALTRAGTGYDVTAHLYRFEHYGVPQMRHRVVLVGIRKDLGRTFRVPKPTTEGDMLPRVADELRGVEHVEHNNERTRHPAKTVEMLSHIPPGKNAWYPGIPKHLQLNVGNCRLSHIYRRLDPDKPAPTVTARGGGGTHGYHWAEPRALTNRERARIQTFPDDFVFLGPKEEVRAQIGMAVPPRGAQAIVEAVLKTLAGVNYEWVEAKWSLPAAELEPEMELTAD